MTTLTTSIQHHVGSPSQRSKQEKENAYMLGRKKQNFLFVDDKTTYVQNPKGIYKKSTRTNQYI